MRPAPSTTVSSGRSVTWTGTSHSCASSMSRPRRRLPPPVRNMPGLQHVVRELGRRLREGLPRRPRRSPRSARPSPGGSRPRRPSPRRCSRSRARGRSRSPPGRSAKGTPSRSRSSAPRRPSRRSRPRTRRGGAPGSPRRGRSRRRCTARPDTTPPIETTAISDRPPPMSTMRFPSGSCTGRPAPIAAASGSSTERHLPPAREAGSPPRSRVFSTSESPAARTRATRGRGKRATPDPPEDDLEDPLRDVELGHRALAERTDRQHVA